MNWTLRSERRSFEDNAHIFEESKVVETAARRLALRAAIASTAVYMLVLHSIGLVCQAFAHANLKVETPAANSTVTPPEKLILKFSEGLEIHFTGVEITGPDGKAVTTGPLLLDPNDETSLIVPITGSLAAGKYRVDWHAVAKDTHKSHGSFSFTVKP
jgi:methionine-rich copper-binding protein CopC